MLSNRAALLMMSSDSRCRRSTTIVVHSVILGGFAQTNTTRTKREIRGKDRDRWSRGIRHGAFWYVRHRSECSGRAGFEVVRRPHCKMWTEVLPTVSLHPQSPTRHFERKTTSHQQPRTGNEHVHHAAEASHPTAMTPITGSRMICCEAQPAFCGCVRGQGQKCGSARQERGPGWLWPLRLDQSARRAEPAAPSCRASLQTVTPGIFLRVRGRRRQTAAPLGRGPGHREPHPCICCKPCVTHLHTLWVQFESDFRARRAVEQRSGVR
mmetsp:Transcript_9786/g.39831  ORF Transcript_9786/g.39831 Transcript_9786/m.39831 type:complete len:267 (+) Transcript_9786:1497-2297(+)